MKTALVCLADPVYYWSQDKLVQSARACSIDQIMAWKHKDFVKTAFYAQHTHILSQPAGVGYWLWKPYIIREALRALSPGDVLIYADAGMEIVQDLAPLVTLCQEKAEVMVFNNLNYTNRAWTKRDCFVLMDCDEKKYWDAVQAEGAFQVYRHSEKALAFVDEWLAFGQNEHIITDLPNACGLPNFPEFCEHRHDQSILSLLSIKYGLEFFRNPSGKGSGFWYRLTFRNSPYGRLLNHHRTKKYDYAEVPNPPAP